MTTKFIQDGKVIDAVAAAAIVSGQPVVVGDVLGIALKDAANTETYPLAIEGVFTIDKTTGTAYAQGDSLDWDASAAKVDKDIATPASGDVENCCVAAAAAASGDTTCPVKLTPGTGTVT